MRIKNSALPKLNPSITKKALIRDNSVPVGQPAPVHVVCNCGSHVQILGAVNMCPKCLVTYSGTGWVIEGRY